MRNITSGESLDISKTSEVYYYAQREKVPLWHYVDVIAIKLTSSPITKEQIDWFASRDLQMNKSDFSSWYILWTDRSSFARLEKPPFIERTGDVYRTESGAQTIVTGRFFTQFYEDVSEEEVMRLNQEYGVSIVKKYDYLGNNYLLEVPWDSKLTALDLANLYHELPSTEYAHPNFRRSISLY